MNTMKREKKMKILKDNDSVYISIHYTTPFSIIRFEGKSEGSMSGLLEKHHRLHGDDLVVFPRCSVFLMHLVVWPFEIQTETTMNHVLIDSTRGLVHRLTSSSFSFVFGLYRWNTVQRKGRRVWHRKMREPLSAIFQDRVIRVT